jgi:fibronectin type 3 domain-containing protein
VELQLYTKIPGTYTVDDSGLQELLQQANALLPDEARYTTDSWSAFITAMTAGQAVTVNADGYETEEEANTVQEQVNVAARALYAAIRALKEHDHPYTSEVTLEPTCTEDGVRTYTCPLCNDVYTEVIDALGHDYQSEVTLEPTHVNKGERTYTCARCDDVYTEDIDPLGLDTVEVTNSIGHKTGNILYWDAVEEVDVYQIFRAVKGSEDEAEQVGETHALAYKDTSADPGVDYVYTVRAVNGEIIGDFSDGVELSRALGTVTLVAGIGHKTGNILYWNAVDGAKTYVVYRRSAGNTFEQIAKTSSTGFKDTTAAPGVDYVYMVRACVGDNLSPSYSNQLTVRRAIDTVTINAETSLAHKTGNIIRWDAVDGAQAYVVYRRTAGHTFEQIARTGGTAYKDTTAEPGVTYVYMVRAAVGYNLSQSYSNQISLVRPQ